jgi:16S rRNA G527 N7-methylase RsmG
MPLYTITAKRETQYEFSIEAEDEASAIAEMNRIELNEDVEEYAYDWYPLEISDIEEEEEVKGTVDFVISRAVTQLKDFYPWVRAKLRKGGKNTLANGVLYLKGGDLTEELAAAKLKGVKQFAITKYFPQDFFLTKYVVYFEAQ